MMKFDFSGKICAVTGAGAGMGQAISLMLAENGAEAVVMVDLGESFMTETIGKMEAIGGNYRCVYGDLSHVDFAKHFVEYTIEEFGRIDVLVNVAGIVQVNSLDTITEADFDRTMAVNVKAPMFATQVAARQMIAQGHGSIVVIASTAGIMGVGNRMAYSTSKGALVIMCKSIAAELAGTNVRINCVCPGTVDTPSMEKRFQAMPDPVAGKKAFMAKELNGRLGTSEELAKTVLFAASDDVDYLNGSTIIVDGGMTCCTGKN